MTREILTFALISAAFASSALQSPVSEYRYVGEYVTNKVSGIVMGDEGDYQAVRYEDLLFFKEAELERSKLYFGYTRTNDYFATLHSGGVVSPEIKLHSLNSIANYYVDPSVRLSSVTRYCTGEVYHVSSASNIHQVVTNTVTVSQTMTNGTEDVHVSSYSFTSNVAWIVVTNRIVITNNSEAYIQNLAFDSNPYTVYDCKKAQDRRLYYEFLGGYPGSPYSRWFVTNGYSVIRACWRTMPYKVPLSLHQLNLNNNSYRERSYRLSGSPSGIPDLVSDNTFAGTPHYYINIYSYDQSTYGIRAEYDSDIGRWKNQTYINRNRYKQVDNREPVKTTLKFVTMIPNVLEEDAGRQVVKRLHAFLYARFTHQKSTTIGYSTTTNQSNYATEMKSTNEIFRAVIPFGSADRLLEESGWVTFTARKEDLANEIMSAISGWGWENLYPATDPSPMLPQNVGERITYIHAQSGLTCWDARNLIYTTEGISMDQLGMIYVLEFKPLTTLSTWTEY